MIGEKTFYCEIPVPKELKSCAFVKNILTRSSDDEITKAHEDKNTYTDNVKIQEPEKNISDSCTENANSIFIKIRRNSPIVLRMLMSYGIPYSEAVNILRRIIYLTLSYS